MSKLKDAIYRMSSKIFGGGGRPQSSGAKGSQPKSMRQKVYNDTYIRAWDKGVKEVKSNKFDYIGKSTDSIVNKIDKTATKKANTTDRIMGKHLDRMSTPEGIKQTQKLEAEVMKYKQKNPNIPPWMQKQLDKIKK